MPMTELEQEREMQAIRAAAAWRDYRVIFRPTRMEVRYPDGTEARERVLMGGIVWAGVEIIHYTAYLPDRAEAHVYRHPGAGRSEWCWHLWNIRAGGATNSQVGGPLVGAMRAALAAWLLRDQFNPIPWKEIPPIYTTAPFEEITPLRLVLDESAPSNSNTGAVPPG